MTAKGLAILRLSLAGLTAISRVARVDLQTDLAQMSAKASSTSTPRRQASWLFKTLLLIEPARHIINNHQNTNQMKKTILTTLITSAMAASVFAQGTVSFKTSSVDLIKFSTDGVTATSVSPGNPATVPSFGAVSIEIWSAASGTTLTTGVVNGLLQPIFTGGWAEAAVTPTQALAAGTYAPVTVTLANGSAGAAQEIEIIGFTGTAAAPTMFGFSGETFDGTQLGALGFSNSTGNPAGSPPTPAALNTGAGEFQGLVLTTIPEPTTMALGGLGAAALLLFRRRK
jgi:hypothetical protein